MVTVRRKVDLTDEKDLAVQLLLFVFCGVFFPDAVSGFVLSGAEFHGRTNRIANRPSPTDHFVRCAILGKRRRSAKSSSPRDESGNWCFHCGSRGLELRDIVCCCLSDHRYL
jgi:hypothetical protein